MTILLDGTSGTRTSRWLKVAPQSAVRHISTIGVIGVPLAFVVARQYERGKASFYGIPEEFVRVGPIDALAPFIAIAGILWLLFIAMHEVERVGIARIANSIGGMLRPLIAITFVIGLGIGFINGLRKEDGVLFILLFFLVYVLIVAAVYAVLWWLPPGIAWIGRGVARAVEKVRTTPVNRGRLERHIFRGAFDYRFSPDLKRSFWVVVTGLILIGKVPTMLGWWDAQSQTSYAVFPGPSKQVILAVYEDKTFTANLDDQRIHTVRMRQTADVKDVQVNIEDLGQSESTHGFMTAVLSLGW
jgi:flagellar basal body-associated protein FliL